MANFDHDRRIGATALTRHLGEWRAAGDTRVSAALAERIRLLVLDGRLGLRTRLPAERELAVALRISRTSVSTAYEQLRGTGYLHSRQGAGSWTSLPVPPSPAGDPSPWSLGGADGAFDLAHACPPAPPEDVHTAAERAAAVLPCYLRQHGYQLLGLPVLRSAVADRFTERGLPTTADQIMITAGAQNALALALAALVEPGDRVLVEHPTYPNALDAVRGRGARPVPVGFPDRGWDLELLTSTIRDAAPRLAYLIPDFQNPTGRVMQAEQRAELVDLAYRTGTAMVIDETLTELGIDGDAPAPVAAKAGADSAPVITVGSASKIFWGGLRIGWLRAPAPLVRRIASARAAIDLASPVLEQLTVTELLPLLGRVRPARLAEFRAAREALRGLLCEHLPSWRLNRPPGGLSLWVDLGEPASSRLVGGAARHGVLLAAGPRFGVDGAFERYLRMPFTLPPDELSDAVPRLAAAWLGIRSGVFAEVGSEACA